LNLNSRGLSQNFFKTNDVVIQNIILQLHSHFTMNLWINKISKTNNIPLWREFSTSRAGQITEKQKIRHVWFMLYTSEFLPYHLNIVFTLAYSLADVDVTRRIRKASRFQDQTVGQTVSKNSEKICIYRTSVESTATQGTWSMYNRKQVHVFIARWKQ